MGRLPSPGAAPTVRPEDAAHLTNARSAYLSGDFRGSAVTNGVVARSPDPFAAALGLRFGGLCAFRLGNQAEAIALFEGAGARARAPGCGELELLVDNHLGAALRRAGRVAQALVVFRAGVDRARAEGRFAVEARLLGNLGALYDELGERSRADDAYARFEALCEVDGEPHRLANARGLAGRAARLRGDHAGARQRFEAVLAHARGRGEPRSVLDACCWLAELALTEARGRTGQGRASCLDDAARWLDEARSSPGLGDAGHRRVRVQALQAELLAVHGRWLAAAAALDEVAELAQAVGPSAEADLSHQRAVVARMLGLRDEASRHLKVSRDVRARLYGPTTGLPDGLGRARIEALHALERELAEELRAVHREGDDGPPDDGPPLWRWRKEAERSAKALWAQILLPRDFERLLPESQGDLLRSEVAYLGPVDDLGRCAHLLAVVFERELGARVVGRVRTALVGVAPVREDLLRRVRRGSLGLGEAGNLIEALRSARGGSPADRALSDLARTLPDLAAVARAFAVPSPIPGLQRMEPVRLTAVRNDVAHGNTEITRSQVDALRRHLTFGDPSPLAALARLPLPPGAPAPRGE